VPAWVDPIGDGVWGLFANQVLLKPGAAHTAHFAPGVCDAAAPTSCTQDGVEWSFTNAHDADNAEGDTGLPVGFSGAAGAAPSRAAPVAPAPVQKPTKLRAPVKPAPATKTAAAPTRRP
jgi:hypothetical protein